MTDLFEIPETLSPRLAWMRKHNLYAKYDDGAFARPWTAWQGIPEGMRHSPVFSDTEEDALLDLAAKLGIPDWRQ